MTRADAARILTHILPLNRQLSHPRSLTDLLNERADAADSGLLRELTYGVCRWYIRLDKIAAQLLHKPFKAVDADIYALVLLGIYQMIYLRIPDHAAIKETAEAARSLRKPWAVKVINGCLRHLQREQAELLAALPTTPAITHAHPQWLIKQLSEAWPHHLEALLAANNQPGPLCLRVALDRIDRSAYLEQLATAEMPAYPGQLAPSAVYLEQACAVETIPGFEAGLVSVQDEAAQLCGFALQPAANEHILDACAAPGGKTGHLLEMTPQLELTALDISVTRLNRVEANLQRLQRSATTVAANLVDFAAQHNGALFDRILLDAPCSATGVIRRHPDIKWLRRRQDIANLAETQATLLRTAFGLLKPGGILVYATCSVLPDENQDLVDAFVATEPTAQLQPLPIAGAPTSATGWQLFPQPGSHDGFFLARLHKAAANTESR